MKNIKSMNLVLVVLVVSISSLTAHAGKRCGLGSRLFGKSKSMLSQTSEMVTNPLVSGGASISYGTSGCKHNGNLIHDSIGKNDRFEDQRLFANANYEELLVEMASGSGSTLASFAETFGCKGSATSAFGEMARKNYPQIINQKEASPDQMLIHLRNSFRSDDNVRRVCEAV
jgi:hypothetical protein